MLDKKMEKALNDQLNAEMASGYLYLSMATYFEDKDLPGFGNALRVHAQEELDHAMKFYDYILRKGGSVVLQAIDTPKREWKNTVEVYEELRKVKMALESPQLLYLLDKEYGQLTNQTEEE